MILGSDLTFVKGFSTFDTITKYVIREGHRDRIGTERSS